jgi:methionyl-tRNA synthetase
MPTSLRKMLVTSALPYANGPIHIGHLVEYIQTDIWVRFQKMRKNDVVFVCADDAHGTPIMLKAHELGITPETLIEQTHREHYEDFSDFLIEFDNYHTTHSEENQELANLFFHRNQAAGHISKREIEQAYDPIEKMFLPDRYIKGDCPFCKAPDQYGDNCEACGKAYSPDELLNPYSVISGAKPIRKKTEHFFFRLQDFEPFLRQWIAEGRVHDSVMNKMEEWFEEGLREWDITRDAPYFGFPIPGHPDKFFYVWLDAPIGYIASFKNWCDARNLDYLDYWKPESDAEIYHFIGKDIIYFHALFWPAMLKGAGFKTPTMLCTHGFLTVNGQKMSKSRGTFIQARTWLDHLPPETLRYYYAAKLGSSIEDIDLNLDDFIKRINSDLVGKLVNIASRCARFINQRPDSRLSAELDSPELLSEFHEAIPRVAEFYEKREFSRAVREIMTLADRANQYIDEKKPWAIAKGPEQQAAVQAICTTGLNFFKLLIGMLKPVLPALATESERFLDMAPMSWESLSTPLLDQAINPFSPLMTRVTQAQVDALIADSEEDLLATPSSTQNAQASNMKTEAQPDSIAPEITIDTFNQIDLRVARILNAEHVEGADKLLRLTLDLNLNAPRQVFAGIKQAYEPEELVGKLCVVVANLKPRKMKFGLSEGMVLATGPGGSNLWILEPNSGAHPGMKVK